MEKHQNPSMSLLSKKQLPANGLYVNLHKNMPVVWRAVKKLGAWSLASVWRSLPSPIAVSTGYQCEGLTQARDLSVRVISKTRLWIVRGCLCRHIMSKRKTFHDLQMHPVLWVCTFLISALTTNYPFDLVLGYHLATVCWMASHIAVAPLNKALMVITHRSDTYLPLANLYLEWLSKARR